MTEIIKKLRPKNRGIQLIASDKNHQFQYEDFCKIVINNLQSLLFVEPFNEEAKLISAMFKWNFFAQKNILFVFNDFDFQDFILVFNNEFRCKKVYDLIYRKRDRDTVTNDQISPILNQIKQISNITISELLMKWLNKLDVEDKEIYTRMMKDDQIYDLIRLNVDSAEESVAYRNNESKERIQRKRRFSMLDTRFKDEDLSAGTRLNHRNRQQNIYAPPQNYNQQDPKYKYENRLQGQDRRISSSSLNAVEQNQQQQLTQPPKSYENRNQNQYNNNQQAQHSRQLP